MSKSKKKSKTPMQRRPADPEARNAYRLLQHMVKLYEAQMSGDINKMPICLMFEGEEGEIHQINTHMELVQYVASVLMDLGFSVEEALQVIFSAKASRDVMRTMYLKP